MSLNSSIPQPTPPFEDALRDFQDGLEDSDEYDFSNITSVDDVYKEIEKTQEEQGRKRKLRNMKKMKPFLDCLTQYSDVLDTLCQIKPDILAAIWGPIKFFLQVSKNHIQGFDKVMEMTRKIGLNLPQFNQCLGLFKENKGVIDVLHLFYRDILDFYVIMLKFFRIKGWRVFFEALWPQYAEKISVVMANMDNHKLLLDSEITIADILDARAARSRALEEYEKNQKARERQDFEASKLSLSPRLYDSELERLKGECCKNTCNWLESDSEFQRWLNSKNKSSGLLWLSGMPGAGKSHLSATFSWKMRQNKENVFFAFLSFQHREETTRVGVLQSLIFQLLYEHRELRPVVQNAYDDDYRLLQTSAEFNQKLFGDLVQCIGTTYVVVDGLDEIPEKERQSLLKGFLELSKQCQTLRILISSRGENDISAFLQARALSVRVGEKNSDDIKLYFNTRVEEWLDSLPIDDTTRSEIVGLVQSVLQKAKGMFLYVKLVIENLEAQPNLLAIREEVENLPDGLDAAYGRILDRIQRFRPREQSHAKTALEWISCSEVSLRKQEILQALMVQEGDQSLVTERKLLQDLSYFCGPIIEYQGDFVNFVHFTAKEYLLSSQSGPYLQESAAHRQIAHTCMTYLMFRCFDLDILEEEVDRAILNGDYVLQTYAMSSWLEHTRRGSRGVNGPEFEHLCRKLSTFLKRRINTALKPTESANKVVLDLLPFRSAEPFIYQCLCAITSSQTLEFINISNPNDKTFRDEPLTLAECWSLTQRRCEALICQSDRHVSNCNCCLLETHYGSRLFKCNRLRCSLSRTGFSSKDARDWHSRLHQRSFKCGFSTCEFSNIGFFSASQLKQHTELCHMEIEVPVEIVADLNEDSLEQAMVDAVEMGEAKYLHFVLEKIVNPPLTLLMHIAYLRGSKVAVLDLLLGRGANIDDRNALQQFSNFGSLDPITPFGPSRYLRTAKVKICEEYNIFQRSDEGRIRGAAEGPQSAVTEAIEGGSVDVIKWLISKNVDVNEKIRNTSLFMTPLDYLFERQRTRCLDRRSRRSLPLDIIELLLDCGADVKDGRALLNLIQCAFLPEEESSYVNVARLLLEHGSSLYPGILHFLVGTNYSIEMARLLVEHGAELDAFYVIDDAMSATPINRALSVGHRKGAEFVRFLVESGATIIPADAMRYYPSGKFARFTGISWDELLESTKHFRNTQASITGASEAAGS